MKIIATILFAISGVAFTEDVPPFLIQNRHLKDIEVVFDASGSNSFRALKGTIKANGYAKPPLLDGEQLTLWIGSEKKIHMCLMTKKKGQTIYLSFNPNDSTHPVHPQKGPMLGFTGKTDQGYSTKNNISQSQVKCVNASKFPEDYRMEKLEVH